MTVQAKTLLLVEDEALIAMEETRLLGKDGYDVVQAFSGAEAVEITGRMGSAIDLILMDIDLGPGMDGTEAAREILKDHDIPVVFLSSHTEKEMVAKTETITSYGYVVKNTGITVLDASIRMAFKLFEAHLGIRAKSMEVEAVNEELNATLEEMESANEELGAANEELERSQRAIMESGERYRVLFDNMRNGFALLEALPGETGMPGDFRFTVINPAFEKLTGLRAGAVVGHTIREAIPNVESQWIERYGRVAVTGESDQFEEYSRDLDSWFSITAFSPQKGKVAVMFENVTKRKRADEELKARDSLIASISNNLPSAMIYRIIRDRDGNRRFSYVSDTVRLFYGCSPEEAIADPDLIYGRVAEEDRDRIRKEEEASFRSLAEFRSEARMLVPDGGVRWSRFISTPEILADGESCWDGIEIDITERKRMEMALRESEERFRRVFEVSPLGMAITGPDFHFRSVNKALCDILGYGPEEFPNLTFREITHPDHLGADEAHVKMLIDGEIPVYRTDKRYIKKDGSVIWADLTLSSVRDENSKLLHYLILIEDITEMRRVEKALRESNHLINDIVSSQPAGIYRVRVGKGKEWNSGGEAVFRYEFISDRFCELTGSTREELNADPSTTLRQIHPDDFDEFNRLNDISNRTTTPFLWEGRMIVREETRWMHFESRPRRLRNGDVIWTGVLLDITDRKRTEETLRVRDEQLRIIYETSQAGIILVDPRGVITFANRRMAEMLGCSLEALVDSSYTDHVHPDQRATGDEGMRKLIHGEVDHVYTERRYIRADGTDFWGYLTGRRHENVAGALVSLVGVITDITEWKRSLDRERDYIDFLEKLEEVDRIIRRAGSLDAMLVDILDRVWDMFGSDRAWLLNPCDPAAPSFRVQMMRTRDEFALDLKPDADVPITPEVAEAFGEALASEEPLVFDPDTGRNAPLGEEFSIRSQIIIVLRPKIGDPWIFGMHQCSHARIWSLQDRRLFREIARRMTDGLNSMLLLRDLRENEERLRTLINAMPDIVCFKDGEGKWLEANDFTLRLFGLEGAGYRGKKDSELAAISPSFREAFLSGEDTDESAWRTGTISRGDVAISRPDGNAMTFDIIRVPEFSPEGRRKGLIVVGRDITERVRAGEALSLSRERFQRMVDSVTDYIYTVTAREGKPVATSHGPACERVTGYSPGDYEADPGLWYRMIHEQDRTMVEAQAARMLSGEGAGPIEHRIIHRNGSTRWVRNTPVLLRDGKGRPTGYDGLVVDITERKRAEEEIVRSAREKDELMKELQHRVKNNLGVIKSLLSLEMDNLADAQSREVFQDAMDRIQSMSTIYEQLYGSSSIDRVDLKKYVADIARRLFNTYAMDSARIALSLSLDDADLDVRRTVPLGLILNELIANALKYAYPSGKGGELRVRLMRAGGDITLEVSDDGPGLPEAVRTGKAMGMGIRLVEMLSKQIEAALVLEGDRGTTARITFTAAGSN